jgi:hypothetical protein
MNLLFLYGAYNGVIEGRTWRREFRDIEQALEKDFLPALFGDDLADDIPGQLASLSPCQESWIGDPSSYDECGIEQDGFYSDLWTFFDGGDTRNRGVSICNSHCHQSSGESRDPNETPLGISGEA